MNCNNNGLCGMGGGNNWWWIIILILIFSCNGSNSYGSCDNNCGCC